MLVLAAVLGALNVIAEVVLAVGDVDDAVNRSMGDVNTTDPIDGLLGLIGIGLVILFLPRRH